MYVITNCCLWTADSNRTRLWDTVRLNIYLLARKLFSISGPLRNWTCSFWAGYTVHIKHVYKSTRPGKASFVYISKPKVYACYRGAHKWCITVNKHYANVWNYFIICEAKVVCLLRKLLHVIINVNIMLIHNWIAYDTNRASTTNLFFILQSSAVLYDANKS